jgi:CheY-like chemotaxis protein
VDHPTHTGHPAPAVGLAAFPALLLQRELITAGDLAVAQARAQRDGLELADAVIVSGVPEDDSYAALAAAAGAAILPRAGITANALALRLLPERLARRHSAVPIDLDNRVLTYATCRPFNAEGESDIAFASGRRIIVKVATRTAIEAALDQSYPRQRPPVTGAQTAVETAPAVTAAPTPDPAAVSAIDMCHQVIARALDAGAADVHIVASSAGTTIRYGTAGTLQPMPDVAVETLPVISERFKIMARVGTAVRNRPQNGAFFATVRERLADVRVSTYPTATGEEIMIRIVGAAKGARSATAERPRWNKRVRVLVTDDEPMTRMLVKVLLEQDRFEVLEAGNGQQALELARREDISLVLIDLNMPVMDGYQTIGALRREFPVSALPIIVLTADDSDSVQRRVLELGADDYLVKPFEPAVLLARVNAVFRRSHIVVAA